MQQITTGAIAPLRNVVNFDSLVRRLLATKPNLPRIGVMYGRSGRGKTYAATFAANEHNAYHVQVGSSWTQRYFCKAVMIEIGLLTPEANIKASIPDMVAMIAKQLATSGKILIIDDAQYLERKGMIELVRDIYEAGQSPLIMIGEEGLPNLLKKWERVHNRVLAWVEAQKCELADCKALARIICDGVEIDADLLRKVCDAVDGCARRIVINLDHIREFAGGRGLTAIDAAAYTDRIETGDHRS
jgi:DNA transposition AAA+ family ATPase